MELELTAAYSAAALLETSTTIICLCAPELTIVATGLCELCQVSSRLLHITGKKIVTRDVHQRNYLGTLYHRRWILLGPHAAYWGIGISPRGRWGIRIFRPEAEKNWDIGILNFQISWT